MSKMVGQSVGVVLQAVQDGFAAFQGNLSLYVPQIFGSWPASDQAEVTQYFQGPKPPCYFSLAYPLQPELMPSCVVSMEAGAEEPNADAFGMQQSFAKQGDGSYQVWYGITQHDRYDISLRHATNQKLLLWLDIVTWWALLQQRQNLIAQGLLQQVLSRSGLEPDPWYNGQGSLPVFRRTVSLTVRHQVGWYETAQSVSSITSTVSQAP